MASDGCLGPLSTAGEGASQVPSGLFQPSPPIVTATMGLSRTEHLLYASGTALRALRQLPHFILTEVCEVISIIIIPFFK